MISFHMRISSCTQPCNPLVEDLREQDRHFLALRWQRAGWCRCCHGRPRQEYPRQCMMSLLPPAGQEQSASPLIHWYIPLLGACFLGPHRFRAQREKKIVGPHFPYWPGCSEVLPGKQNLLTDVTLYWRAHILKSSQDPCQAHCRRRSNFPVHQLEFSNLQYATFLWIVRRRLRGTLMGPYHGPCAPKHQNNTFNFCLETYYQSLEQLPGIFLLYDLICIFLFYDPERAEKIIMIYSVLVPLLARLNPYLDPTLLITLTPKGNRMTQWHKNAYKIEY